MIRVSARTQWIGHGGSSTEGQPQINMQRGTTANPVGRFQPQPTRCNPALGTAFWSRLPSPHPPSLDPLWCASGQLCDFV